MPYRNTTFESIQSVKRAFHTYIDSEYANNTIGNPVIDQLETALENANSAAFKLLHPIFIKMFRTPRARFSNSILSVVGLDIETEYTTGMPKLLGFWYPKEQLYQSQFNPTLDSFFQRLRDIVDHNTGISLVTWGNLDLQCLLRLFDPTEVERKRIARGITANIKDGKIIGSPPALRQMAHGRDFYIASYIPGQSLKLGYLENGQNRTVWIFNVSQFYPDRIANTAKGLNLEWHQFPEDTHLIRWSQFSTNPLYRQRVLDSNKQDARIVSELATAIQQRFYDVFDCYPTLLISTGSLVDAATSKLLSNGTSDYMAVNWKWLTQNIWKDTPETAIQIELLLSEAYSAGYVDQFALGYFKTALVADISSAYPHKIRALPDLRLSRLHYGTNQLENDLQALQGTGLLIESAIIRGKVTIPDTLVYHPITVKSVNRENYRPLGTFYAAYTLEERRFCESYGATFSEEEYVIIALTEYKPSPLAYVSERLGMMRDQIREQMTHHIKGTPEYILLDGQQYITKVVDNSGYGKTVMTTSVVEDIQGEPQIVGYMAGDRFNMLYGTLITARTRVQLAAACMQLAANGGKPIMTMTDSIYWEGSSDQLPLSLFAPMKTAGYFEAPEEITNFYVLKTGQYEYQKGNTWYYKLRGLPVLRDKLNGSFFRTLIQNYHSELTTYQSPDKVKIPIPVRRLVTIGKKDLTHLGMVADDTTDIKPFVLSSKHQVRYIHNWPRCINGHIWLDTPKITERSKELEVKQLPLKYLHDRYLNQLDNHLRELEIHRITTNRKSTRIIRLQKLLYCVQAMQLMEKLPPPNAEKLSWRELYDWYGIEITIKDMINEHNVV